MQQLVILSLKRTLPSCFICGKFLMQDFVWRLMQTSKTRPYERVIPVLHTLSLLCGYSGKTHLWESSWESGVHRAYNCWPTNTLTCVIFPVRCHDPLQPLPDSVWAFDKPANITKALLCCGPEHSEEDQDGDDHTRCYAHREISYTQWSPVRGRKINTLDRLISSLHRLFISEESHCRAALEEWALHFAGKVSNLWMNLCEKGAGLKGAVCRNWPPVEFIQNKWGAGYHQSN